MLDAGLMVQKGKSATCFAGGTLLIAIQVFLTFSPCGDLVRDVAIMAAPLFPAALLLALGCSVSANPLRLVGASFLAGPLLAWITLGLGIAERQGAGPRPNWALGIADTLALLIAGMVLLRLNARDRRVLAG